MNQRFQSAIGPRGLKGSLLVCVLLLLGVLAGCESKETAVSDHASSASSPVEAKDQPPNPPLVPRELDEPQHSAGHQESSSPPEPPSRQEDGPKVAPLPVQFQGPDAEAKQLQVDAEKLLAHGIRTIAGKRLILHTDIPLDDELRSLPELFDKATTQFCDYFDIELQKVADWQVRACVIQDLEKFERAGLLPQVLPKFQHGYALGDRIFLKEQPSEYYRRHLLLHEGTHSFMLRFFQGAGPPWYMEGMAELLATHHWDGAKLTLNTFPADKNEVPFWGRVKIVKDDVAAQKGKMIEEVMQYGSNAHLNVEAYGWSWAAAKFLDQHPQFQAIFRKHIEHAGDSSGQFSISLVETYGEEWFKVRQEWQLFVMNMEYGYDIAREAIEDVEVQQYADLPSEQTFQVHADRGWQSTGLYVTQGMKIQVTATGRFVIYREQADDPEGTEGQAQSTVWESEAGGVSIRYHGGYPLGTLLVAIDNLQQTGLTGLLSTGAIGTGGDIEIPQDGVLYFRVNDSPAELAENQGNVEVKLSLLGQDQ